jgi:predicted RNA-binding protein with PUA-like domain
MNNYWLFKSEPDEFSIDDLKTVGVEAWNGVRNYQARNFMRDEMKKGDALLFYHSSCPVPGVAGEATIDRMAYPDPTALDKKSKYYDEKSTADNPRWLMVDVKFKKKYKKVITLDDLRAHKLLQDLLILRKGNRLSITPLTQDEFEFIQTLDA